MVRAFGSSGEVVRVLPPLCALRLGKGSGQGRDAAAAANSPSPDWNWLHLWDQRV